MTARRSRLVALAVIAGLLGLSGLVTTSLAAFTSTSSSNAQVRAAADWTSPVVALADPGSPLKGTVTLTATATDADSAVASVTIERSPAGQGAWTAVCTRTAAPYNCAWNTTTVPDGGYDLRAVAVDTAGNTGRSAVRAARIVDNVAPTVALDPLPTAVRGTVTVGATAADAGTGVVSVRIQRAPADTATWTDLCTATAAPYRCSWNTAGLTSGHDYDLRAIATDGAGNTTTSALESTTIDNVAPTVSVTVPSGTLSGTVTIGATATDAHSDVDHVVLQYATASSPTTWIDICTDDSRPYSCRFDTTQLSSTFLVGSNHSFRAVATDLAGNVATSSSVTRTVNNTFATAALGPVPPYSRGTVTLTATTNASLVHSVAFQRAPQGSNTWTTICTTSTAPYTCDWNTATVTDGTYQLRAVVSHGILGSATTPIETTIVDNTPLRGLDVQTTNGGHAGRVDAGDVLHFTYSEQLDLTSLIAGWDGSPRNGLVRLRDGGVLGLGGTDDSIDVFVGNNTNTSANLGSVNLRGDYIRDGRTQNVSAILTATTETVGGKPVTVVHVQLTSSPPPGQLRTNNTPSTMRWTPSANARDLAGNRTSTETVVESGPADRDF